MPFNSIASPQIENQNINQIVKELIGLTVPFASAHLALMTYTILNGIIINHLDNNAVAAAPIVGTCSYLIFSSIDGVLYATGVLIGETDGWKTNPHKIGEISRQSWILSFLMAIPAMVILSQLENILILCDINEEVSHTAQKYFSAINYGTIPIILNFSDQQLILGLNKPKITFISVGLSSLMSMIFGYPLTLGLWGLPKLGLAGIGYGAAISGTVSLIGLRLYMYFNASFKIYYFYDTSHLLQFSRDLKKIVSLGLPIGFQNFSAWFNLAVLSLLLGKQSTSGLVSEQASISIITAYMIIILAFSQANATTVARYYGVYNQAPTEQKDKVFQYIQKIGYSGLLLGGGVSLVTAIILCIFSEEISQQYIHSETDNIRLILKESKKMLITNAIGLVPDTIRVVLTGVLRGYEDVNFAPLISFFMMTILALPVGGVLVLNQDMDSNWLFITRNTAILMTSFILFHRLQKKKPIEHLNENYLLIHEYENVNENQETIFAMNA